MTDITGRRRMDWVGPTEFWEEANVRFRSEGFPDPRRPWISPGALAAARGSRRQPLLHERVPLVAVRAAPEHVVRAVAAGRADVRVPVEDGPLRGVDVGQGGRGLRARP